MSSVDLERGRPAEEMTVKLFSYAGYEILPYHLASGGFYGNTFYIDNKGVQRTKKTDGIVDFIVRPIEYDKKGNRILPKGWKSLRDGHMPNERKDWLYVEVEQLSGWGDGPYPTYNCPSPKTNPYKVHKRHFKGACTFRGQWLQITFNRDLTKFVMITSDNFNGAVINEINTNEHGLEYFIFSRRVDERNPIRRISEMINPLKPPHGQSLSFNEFIDSRSTREFARRLYHATIKDLSEGEMEGSCE